MYLGLSIEVVLVLDSQLDSIDMVIIMTPTSLVFIFLFFGRPENKENYILSKATPLMSASSKQI